MIDEEGKCRAEAEARGLPGKKRPKGKGKGKGVEDVRSGHQEWEKKNKNSEIPSYTDTSFQHR